MKKAFITGANKSIGFETARQLLQKGYFVYLGSRNIDNGNEAVDKLKAEDLNNVEAIQIDVTDQDSVKAARAAIGKKTAVLDVLINNAGISGGLPQTATSINIEVFKNVYDTNLFGVVMVTQAFLDLLHKSTEPRIVNVTSGLGSLTMNNDPKWPYYNVKAAAYNSSKAALNMYTIVNASVKVCHSVCNGLRYTMLQQILFFFFIRDQVPLQAWFAYCFTNNFRRFICRFFIAGNINNFLCIACFY